MDGAETEIQEIHLQLPARLSFELKPAQDPFLQAWQLRLSKLSPVPGHLDIVAEGEALDGSWQVAGLDPGEYEITVEDSRGSVWWSEEFEAESGEQQRHLDLPFMRVKGTVRLGTETLVAARLRFVGTEGSMRLHSWTREDGNFYVFLPPERSWNVEVETSQPPVHVFLADQEVTRRLGQSTAEMLIELPATRLEGEVLDETGTAVPGARVQLRRRGTSTRSATPRSAFAARPSSQRTSSDGCFKFNGLEPGRWLVTASLQTEERSAVAESIEVSVQEDFAPPWLRLELRSLRAVHGQVITPQGLGIPGAQVYGALPTLEWIASSPRQTITGLDGEFELQVPEQATQLDLLVLPPGFTARMLRIGLTKPGPIIVEAGLRGGRLSVVLAEPRDHLFYRGASYPGHLTWPPALVRTWAEISGQRAEDVLHIRASGMPPGDYVLCTADLPGDVIWLGPPLGDPRCVTGSLQSYGELLLQTPGVSLEAEK